MTSLSDLKLIFDEIIYWCNYEFYVFGYSFTIFGAFLAFIILNIAIVAILKFFGGD